MTTQVLFSKVEILTQLQGFRSDKSSWLWIVAAEKEDHSRATVAKTRFYATQPGTAESNAILPRRRFTSWHFLSASPHRSHRGPNNGSSRRRRVAVGDRPAQAGVRFASPAIAGMLTPAPRSKALALASQVVRTWSAAPRVLGVAIRALVYAL